VIKTKLCWGSGAKDYKRIMGKPSEEDSWGHVAAFSDH